MTSKYSEHLLTFYPILRDGYVFFSSVTFSVLSFPGEAFCNELVISCAASSVLLRWRLTCSLQYKLDAAYVSSASVTIGVILSGHIVSLSVVNDFVSKEKRHIISDLGKIIINLHPGLLHGSSFFSFVLNSYSDGWFFLFYFISFISFLRSNTAWLLAILTLFLPSDLQTAAFLSD